jgi:predicted ArsR family transcriptional regulator
MTLSTLRDYLSTKGRVTLSDIAIHFDTTPEAARPLLDRWREKGRVLCHEGGQTCGKANCSCSAPLPAVYEWRSP